MGFSDQCPEFGFRYSYKLGWAEGGFGAVTYFLMLNEILYDENIVKLLHGHITSGIILRWFPPYLGLATRSDYPRGEVIPKS